MIDINTKTGVAAISSVMLTAAKYTLEQQGGCAVAVLFPEDNSEPTAIEPKLPLTEENKSVWLDEIRTGVKKISPVAIFFACQANRMMVAPGIAGPEQQEVIDAWMEHKAFGKLGWEANIIRGDSEKPKITPFRERPAGMVAGPFSDLLKTS